MKYVRACSHGDHDIDDTLSANQAVTDFKGTLQQRSDARYGLHVGLHGVHTELLAATIYQSLKLIINITSVLQKSKHEPRKNTIQKNEQIIHLDSSIRTMSAAQN